jgi:hypothetical protein
MPLLDLRPMLLPLLDPQRGLTDRVVRLADYAGQKPVALIFGSYT